MASTPLPFGMSRASSGYVRPVNSASLRTRLTSPTSSSTDPGLLVTVQVLFKVSKSSRVVMLAALNPLRVARMSREIDRFRGNHDSFAYLERGDTPVQTSLWASELDKTGLVRRQLQRRDCAWCSVTNTLIGGMSITWRRSNPT